VTASLTYVAVNEVVSSVEKLLRLSVNHRNLRFKLIRDCKQ
jgi:hypothetical protein